MQSQSSMEDFVPPTSPHGNPNSSSLTYNYHFPFDDFEGSLYNNHSPNLPSYLHDSTSSFKTDDTDPVVLLANTSSGIAVDATSMPQPHNIMRYNLNGERVNDRTIIALRTRTQLQVLDDGYRWRKYGKKKVKSNPNLRNYYKCLNVGCKVKKRVERDKDDSSYVIATYIGTHNHDAIMPCNDTRPTEFAITDDHASIIR